MFFHLLRVSIFEKSEQSFSFLGQIYPFYSFPQLLPIPPSKTQQIHVYTKKIGRTNHQHIMAFSFSRHAQKLSIVPFLFFLKASLTCIYRSTLGKITQFTSSIYVASSILQFTSSIKLIRPLEAEIPAEPSLPGAQRSSLSPLILRFLLRIISGDQTACEYKQIQRKWKGHAIKG